MKPLILGGSLLVPCFRLFSNGVDKASRPSISNVVEILSSDTCTICQLNQLFSISEPAIRSRMATFLSKSKSKTGHKFWSPLFVEGFLERKIHIFERLT